MPPRVAVLDGETVVTLDAAAQRAAGIEVVAVSNRPQMQAIRAFGAAVDPQALSDLHNSYVNAAAQLGMARAKLRQSQLAFERSQRLVAAQADTLANRDAAEAAFRVDQATVLAAQAQLQTLAANAQQNWGSTLGNIVVRGDATFTRLAARQDVLVQVSLSPGQLLAQPPHEAAIRFESGPRVPIAYLSDAPKADPHIQGASYFYVAHATPGLLAGMNVVAELPSDRAAAGAVVPASAVVWWQGKAWVYERTASVRFVRRPLAGDALASNGPFVVAGLHDGASVVTRGAQALLSEEFRPQTAAGEDQE
ncbi:MAG: efflux RND transporter periplasmic adaptor subunit [Alphaproteobacteria bacterium]|nr:efflux RND transporter periplasmic adaptor subunit [Alphaproteobacteria bacterium]